MKAIVWSKNQCPYCDQAKALLKQKGKLGGLLGDIAKRNTLEMDKGLGNQLMGVATVNDGYRCHCSTLKCHRYPALSLSPLQAVYAVW